MSPLKSSHSKVRRNITAGLGVVVALAVVVTASAFAATGHDGRAADRGTGGKPTVVLVHGGWADSSGWNDSIASLQGRGYPVIAPANPLRSLATDSAYISSVLATIEGSIVLVGHSYGGAVISNAAVGHPNVEALVYIAAFAPDEGETLGGLVTMNPGTQIGPETLTFRPYPLPGGGEGLDTYIKARAFRSAFAGDLSRDVTRVMAATQRPFAASVFDEESGAPAWKTIPSWYLVARHDHAIPPATQRFMAERARAQTVGVKSSHVPMISRPHVVTHLILNAAQFITSY